MRIDDEIWERVTERATGEAISAFEDAARGCGRPPVARCVRVLRVNRTLEAELIVFPARDGGTDA